MSNFFANTLISWYKSNHRDLPWRRTKDPYKIWLSEIILQQTRVNQGLPYYEKFVESFPAIHDLASADEQQVLRLWQGLGYYSRARNLHACAKLIVSQFNGKFPSEYNELQQLPGVGRYTAAAIASFAFDKAVPAIDGNAMRVLARYFGLRSDIAASSSFKEFYNLSMEQIPANQPAIYNQAIMEFGATVCKPKAECSVCVFQNACYAFENRQQEILPIKNNKLKVRDRYFSYFVVRNNNRVLMRKRPEKDIWTGLYDFYLKEDEKEKNFDSALDKNLIQLLSSDKAVLKSSSKTYKHMLTHQRIYSNFYEVEVDEEAFNSFMEEGDLGEYSITEVRKLPKSALIENYLQEHIF